MFGILGGKHYREMLERWMRDGTPEQQEDAAIALACLNLGRLAQLEVGKSIAEHGAETNIGPKPAT